MTGKAENKGEQKSCKFWSLPEKMAWICIDPACHKMNLWIHASKMSVKGWALALRVGRACCFLQIGKHLWKKFRNKIGKRGSVKNSTFHLHLSQGSTYIFHKYVGISGRENESENNATVTQMQIRHMFMFSGRSQPRARSSQKIRHFQISDRRKLFDVRKQQLFICSSFSNDDVSFFLPPYFFFLPDLSISPINLSRGTALPHIKTKELSILIMETLSLGSSDRSIVFVWFVVCWSSEKNFFAAFLFSKLSTFLIVPSWAITMQSLDLKCLLSLE